VDGNPTRNRKHLHYVQSLKIAIRADRLHHIRMEFSTCTLEFELTCLASNPRARADSHQHRSGAQHATSAAAGSANATFLPRGTGQYIRGTYSGPGTDYYEKIDPTFCVRDREFFGEGRVFAVIMNETAGSNSTSDPTAYNPSISVVKYTDNFVHTQTRRFVVVRHKPEFCYACPIYTYKEQGTLKRGVRAKEHGIAHSWGQPPQLLANEEGITKRPIPVVMFDGQRNLSPASRIYYGIHHPIQYNVKVKYIGYVPADHIPILIGNWREEDDEGVSQQSPSTAPPFRSPQAPPRGASGGHSQGMSNAYSQQTAPADNSETSQAYTQGTSYYDNGENFNQATSGAYEDDDDEEVNDLSEDLTKTYLGSNEE
jgi:hypothetical protein